MEFIVKSFNVDGNEIKILCEEQTNYGFKETSDFSNYNGRKEEGNLSSGQRQTAQPENSEPSVDGASVYGRGKYAGQLFNKQSTKNRTGNTGSLEKDNNNGERDSGNNPKREGGILSPIPLDIVRIMETNASRTNYKHLIRTEESSKRLKKMLERKRISEQTMNTLGHWILFEEESQGLIQILETNPKITEDKLMEMFWGIVADYAGKLGMSYMHRESHIESWAK